MLRFCRLCVECAGAQANLAATVIDQQLRHAQGSRRAVYFEALEFGPPIHIHILRLRERETVTVAIKEQLIIISQSKLEENNQLLAATMLLLAFKLTYAFFSLSFSL